MKQYLPFGILVLAFLTVVFSCFGPESYSRLVSLRKSLSSQTVTNDELEGRVLELKESVMRLQKSERELEKAARNGYGLAHPNEEIYIFEKKTR